LIRSVHGIELTAAGRAFLDHARLALTQRRRPAKRRDARRNPRGHRSRSASSPAMRWIGFPR
jgi:LysR family hca operon transcriptional activator